MVPRKDPKMVALLAEKKAVWRVEWAVQKEEITDVMKVVRSVV